MAELQPLTQKRIDAIIATPKGATQVDHVDGTVPGLTLRVSPGGTCTWNLTKRLPGAGVKRIKLGRYVKGQGADDTKAATVNNQFPSGYEVLSLAQARKEARRVLTLIDAGRSPTHERERAKHLQHVHAERGSFADLLGEYISVREAGTEKRAAAGERQIADWRRMLAYLTKEAPAILDMKARDVEPAHIVGLLRPIFHKGVARPKSGRGSGGRRAKDGAQGSADKLQAFLRAAFAYGLSSELSVARKVERAYGLVHNPVAVVPREAKSTPGTRALSAGELRQFYLTIDQAPNVGPILANLLRFVIASGGQRASQLAQAPWASYDVADRVAKLVDSKGRGGVKRPHWVPMTQRMVDILEAVRPISGTNVYPWSTRTKGHVDIGSPGSAVAYWLSSEHAVVDGAQVAPFTPRDLRRTVTQLMQAAGVSDELADRLQSHGVSGVTGTHYRNNPELYLPDRRKALEAFDAELEKILSPVLP